MNRSKTLKLDIYHTKIDICIGTKKEIIAHVKKYYKRKIDYSRYLKLLAETENNTDGGGIVHDLGWNFGYYYYTLYLQLDNFSGEKYRRVNSVYSHEAYHVVELMAKLRGFSRGEDGAYLIGEIVDKGQPLLETAEGRLLSGELD